MMVTLQCMQQYLSKTQSKTIPYNFLHKITKSVCRKEASNFEGKEEFSKVESRANL